MARKTPEQVRESGRGRVIASAPPEKYDVPPDTDETITYQATALGLPHESYVVVRSGRRLWGFPAGVKKVVIALLRRGSTGELETRSRAVSDSTLGEWPEFGDFPVTDLTNPVFTPLDGEDPGLKRTRKGKSTKRFWPLKRG